MIPAMDEDAFWDLIERARGSAKPFHQALADDLVTRTEQEILDYQDRLDEVRRVLNRWDIWAAAHLINGGCSENRFSDFRAGLVAQGRDWYARVLASPDSLADHPAACTGRGSPLFYEQLGYVASFAFARVTGDGEAFYAALGSRDPGDDDPVDLGEQFDFDDPEEMRRRLPRLSAALTPVVDVSLSTL
jgi:hypothetical protein